MAYNPQKSHRRSIRLPGYDYATACAYFVTLVTQGRACLFGEIVASEMHLSALGQITEEHWRAIPVHSTNVELGAYVILPNHIHGVLILNDSMERGSVEKFQKPVAGSIPTIIRSYKASATRTVGVRDGAEIVRGDVVGARYIVPLRKKPQQETQSRRPEIWQRNYYEHIIRSDEEYERFRLYIEANPVQWLHDDNHPGKAQ